MARQRQPERRGPVGHTALNTVIPESSFFTPSGNCWKLATAPRAAMLVDGREYFRVVHETLLRASRAIFIVGWDLHSELELIREDGRGGSPSRLGKLLNRLGKEKPELQVYLLCWDFAMIYSMEREFFPRYKLKWRTRRNIHFGLDGEHPVGASQHQKLVVIDDSLAFAGGLDLTKRRWDTPEHHPDDARRKDPDGQTYAPFHDVQMMVDGEAAATLGELARERWNLAMGTNPPGRLHNPESVLWPDDVKPDFENVEVAVARTLPAFKGRPEVREVERLYLEGIAAACRSIYIENQYLSSYRIGEALSERLREPDGPEVLLVLPKQSGGWLEHYTMDVLRSRILRKLRRADQQQRLGVYSPRIAADPELNLMVHAKVMIVDDRLLRIGSSNCSNRSLGLDSECDLALCAEPGSPEAETIAALRSRLLAEHLGLDGRSVDQAVAGENSLLGAVESLRQGERTLVPLVDRIPEDVEQWVPESELLDPEKPLDPDELADSFLGPRQKRSAFRQLSKALLLLAALLCLALLWRWTPLNTWVTVESTLEAATWIERQPLAPILVPAAYVLGGLVSFPVTLMIIATVIIFGPWLGLVYALLGAELSALFLFFLGRRLGQESVSRLTGGLLNRLNQKLSKSGLMAVITFRIVPVAPFSVINLIAGVSRLRLRDFALGTFIGLLPGVIAIVILADRIAVSLQEPDFTSLASMLAALVLVAAGLFGLRKWLRSGKKTI